MRYSSPCLLLVLLVGCGAPKLNEERKFDVDFGGTTYDLPKVKAEQKVTVEATSTTEPIDVYVFLTKNKATVDKAVLRNTQDGVIAGKEKQQSVSLEATIPANEEWSVLVKASGMKNAAGTVKMKNR
jgi:hypothetical protein